MTDRAGPVDRRTVLAMLAATMAAPGAAFGKFQVAGAVPTPTESGLFLAARNHGGRFEVAAIGRDGRDRFVLPLSTRGHGFAVAAAGRRAVAFSRELGGMAIGLDPVAGGAVAAFAPGPGRHFYGHGAFSGDGRLLLATENAFDTGDGVVGVYDAAAAFRRVGEFPTAGIGPHEALLLPDGNTLVVANGGIATHPDYGEQKLNLADMAPSLAYLDIARGVVVDQVALPPDLHQLSIRHLALAGDAVWFGCQYEGPGTDDPPLVGRHRRGRPPELFAGPPELRRSLRNYVGSVAADMSGVIVAVASPKGGVIAFFDAATGRSLGTEPMEAGCGLAPLEPEGFLATGGGVVGVAGPNTTLAAVSAVENVAWDNHVVRVPG